MLWIFIFGGAAGFAAIATLIKGGPRERRGLALLLAASVAVIALARFAPDLPWLRLPPELALLAGFCMLAWKYERPWPAWAAGWTLVLVCIEAYGAYTGLGSDRAALLAAAGAAASLGIGALKPPWKP